MNEFDGLVKSGHSKFYDRLYTPWVTLLVFIAQVLDSDGSKKPRSGLTFDMQAMLISSLDQLNFILDVQMSRPLRIEFVGALYHVIARGNAREDI